MNDDFENVIVALKTTGTPTVATPTLSPGSGTYTSVQSVTISSWTAGTTVYYTTNGTMPTTSSTMYTGPVTVSVSETLEAIATAPGFANSPMNSAVYTVDKFDRLWRPRHGIGLGDLAGRRHSSRKIRQQCGCGLLHHR